MTFKLERVGLMPKDLQQGILYVSEEYHTAAHLCACGCGSKVRTPLGPTEWTFTDSPGGPSLWPSIGNWQKPCRSHYFIRGGQVLWRREWSESEVLAGRLNEAKRREAYFGGKAARQRPTLWGWIRRLFRS